MRLKWAVGLSVGLVVVAVLCVGTVAFDEDAGSVVGIHKVVTDVLSAYGYDTVTAEVSVEGVHAFTAVKRLTGAECPLSGTAELASIGGETTLDVHLQSTSGATQLWISWHLKESDDESQSELQLVASLMEDGEISSKGVLAEHTVRYVEGDASLYGGTDKTLVQADVGAKAVSHTWTNHELGGQRRQSHRLETLIKATEGTAISEAVTHMVDLNTLTITAVTERWTLCASGCEEEALPVLDEYIIQTTLNTLDPTTSALVSTTSTYSLVDAELEELPREGNRSAFRAILTLRGKDEARGQTLVVEEARSSELIGNQLTTVVVEKTTRDGVLLGEHTWTTCIDPPSWEGFGVTMLGTGAGVLLGHFGCIALGVPTGGLGFLACEGAIALAVGGATYFAVTSIEDSMEEGGGAGGGGSAGGGGGGGAGSTYSVNWSSGSAPTLVKKTRRHQSYVTGESVITDAPGFNEYRWFDEDFSWTHLLQLQSGNISFDVAYLEIEAWDVDVHLGAQGEWNFISVDGRPLGYLTGQNNQWSTTTFDIGDPGGVLCDGAAEVFVDIDQAHNYRRWAMTIRKSTLKYGYWLVWEE